MHNIFHQEAESRYQVLNAIANDRLFPINVLKTVYASVCKNVRSSDQILHSFFDKLAANNEICLLSSRVAKKEKGKIYYGIV